MHRTRLLAVLALVVALSACQMRVEVGVDAHEDGSGMVRVAVGLDGDAVHKLGGIDHLRAIVKVDDLTASGWKVTGPAARRDGFVWLEATKPFDTPEQAAAVLEEVAGGPFHDFHLERDRTFARTTLRFAGTVDFSQGLESFSDPELTAALDGQPLGQDVAAIEKQFGGSLDRLVHVKVAVRLPGAVSSNAPGQANNGAVWEPRLSDDAPAMLTAESRVWHRATLAFLVLAALAAFALLVFLLVIVADRLRHRRALATGS